MLQRGWRWGLLPLAGCLGLTACERKADVERVRPPEALAVGSSAGFPAEGREATPKTTVTAANAGVEAGRIETSGGTVQPAETRKEGHKPKMEPPRSPIRWTPVEKAFPVAEGRALELARRYGGFNDARKVTARRVLFTDADAFFLKLEKRPAWLVTFEGVTLARSQPSSTPPEERSLTIYLVLDGETGDCLEAFSEPRPEWVVPKRWTEMKKVLEGANVKYQPPRQAPHCTVKRALEVAELDPYRAGQVIARYVSFTDTGYGLEVRRSDGAQVVNFWTDRPAWALSFMGIYYPLEGGPPPPSGEPAPPREPLYHTERNIVIDDVQEKPLASFGGR